MTGKIPNRFTLQEKEKIGKNLSLMNQNRHSLIVVLDDDPTGVQTVHDINVYTDWEKDKIIRAFSEESNMFFILTNSRGLTETQTTEVHTEIANNLIAAQLLSGRDYILVSRSDSTLRGHYPLETTTLRNVLENNKNSRIDGEIIVPAFIEGGRYTINDIHYVEQDGKLIAAGQTEFAHDKTFGYTSSNLKDWCAEKTAGGFPASGISSISLEMLDRMDYDMITQELLRIHDFNKVIVNATCYEHLAVFTTALLRALQQGKKFLFRSSASFVKTLGGIDDKPLLKRDDLIEPNNRHGGVIVIGSHVNKTTRQMEALRQSDLPLVFLEFNQHRALEIDGLLDEARMIRQKCAELIRQGKTCVIYTKRERFDLPDGDEKAQLELAVKISESLISIISQMEIRPSFIIAKGGITSSDIGTKALSVKKANVLGQAAPGIPVWKTGTESKFPGLPFIIFPGNVGSDNTLKDIVENLVER